MLLVTSLFNNMTFKNPSKPKEGKTNKNLREKSLKISLNTKNSTVIERISQEK